jgi:hypothetical protein
LELEGKFVSEGGDEVLRHYTNPSFYFSDQNSDSTDSMDLIDVYLDLSIDFDFEYLPSPYRKRTKSYAVNVVYKTKDKKVQLVDKVDEVEAKPDRRRDWYDRSKARDIVQKQFGIY